MSEARSKNKTVRLGSKVENMKIKIYSQRFDSYSCLNDFVMRECGIEFHIN